jgi:hypothetical protein
MRQYLRLVLLTACAVAAAFTVRPRLRDAYLALWSDYSLVSGGAAVTGLVLLVLLALSLWLRLRWLRRDLVRAHRQLTEQGDVTYPSPASGSRAAR